MTDRDLQSKVIDELVSISKEYRVMLVHGGGPFIARFLEMASITTEFFEGHRITEGEAIHYVEAALKGYVNGSLTGICQQKGINAVGLSGKDGNMVHCKKKEIKGRSLGWVGDITEVNTELLDVLLEREMMPVITCIATDHEGKTYNVNGDIFAASIAAALKADHFLVLTNTDGLYEDIDRPETLIHTATEEELKTRYKNVISGGMLPKIEACMHALKSGVGNVRILNGTKPEVLSNILLKGKEHGTRFLRSVEG